MVTPFSTNHGPADAGCDMQQISVQLQGGFSRETVSLTVVNSGPGGRLAVLTEAASAFVSRKYPGFASGGDHSNRLLLFLHDNSDPNILRRLSSSTDIPDGAVVEIVLSSAVAMSTEDLSGRPHLLSVHSYKTPHFCDFCGEMLWGLVKQGLKCEGCGLSFHKRCVHKIPPNDCKFTRRRRKSSAADEYAAVSPPQMNKTQPLSSRSFSKSRDGENDTGGGGGSGGGGGAGGAGLPKAPSSSQIQVPHTFVSHNFTRPMHCQHCHKLMPLFRQGYQCCDCKFNCHKKCSESVPNNCSGEYKYDLSLLETDESEIPNTDEAIPEHQENGTSGEEGSDSSPSNPEGKEDEKLTADRLSSSNIPLQRIVQSVKHTKRTGSKVIREGWMVCYTNRDKTRKRHFWKVDSKAITLFCDDTTNRYYKEILLKDIARVDPFDVSASKKSDNAPVFEFQVGETVYYVGEDPGPVKNQASTNSGIGKDLAVYFENAIRQALLPVMPQNGAAPKSGNLPKTKKKKVPTATLR